MGLEVPGNEAMNTLIPCVWIDTLVTSETNINCPTEGPNVCSQIQQL